LLIAVCMVTLTLAQFPLVVLHDQYDNDLKDSTVSEIRPDPPEPSAEATDNFVIPVTQTWQSSRQL
jgi:hypothetical protein